MRKQLLLTIALFITSISFGQAKSVYFELFGPGLASFNFDTRFTKKDGGIGGRVGVGYFRADGTSLLTIPVGLNYLLSKNNKNFFEIGAGVTYGRVKEDFNSFPDDDDVFDGSFGHLHFGYRLQPAEGGFLFRAGVTPIFGNGAFVPYYISLAVGYKF